MSLIEKRQPFVFQIRIVLCAVFTAVLFWILEAFIHHAIFFHSNFIKELVYPGAHELWMRLIVVLLIILFGIIAQMIINRRTGMMYFFAVSEKRYRTLFEKSPAAITLINTEGHIVNCNYATEKMTGFSREEIIGKPFNELLTLKSSDLPQLQEKFKCLILGQDVAPYELEIIKKDGEVRWIEVINSLLIIDKEVAGIQVIATDITEQKKTELLLQEKERRFRELTDLLPEGVFEIDLNSKFIFANKRALELSGYSEEDLKQDLYATQMFIPDEQERVKNNISEILGGKDIGPQKYVAVKKDGVLYTVLIHSSVIVRDGKKVGLRGVIVDVSELEEIEVALKMSEEKYRLLSENIPCVVYSALPDEHSTTTFISGRMEQLTGYPVTQFLNEPTLWSNIIYVQDREQVWNKIREHREKKCMLDVEYRIVTRAEEIVWIRDCAVPILDRNNKIIRIDGYMEDITIRKKAEVAVKTAEERYRSFIQNFHGIAFQGTIDFKPIFFHGAIKEITGYIEEDFLTGKLHWDEIIHPEDKSKIYNSKIKTKPNFSEEREYRIINKNGETKWIYEFIQNICDDAGKPARVQGSIYDITVRKRIEKALRDSENKYRTLFESAPEPMVLFKPDGYLVDCNKSAALIAGMSREELIGKNFVELNLIPEDEKQNMANIFEDIKEKQRSEPFEVNLLLNHLGQVIFEIYPALLHKDDKLHMIQVVFRDITAARKLEQTLKTSARQWIQTFDAIGDSVCILDTQGMVLRCNEAMTRLTGKHYKDILGRTCCESLHDRKQPQDNCPLKKMREKLERITEITQTADGRSLSTVADPIINENKELIGIVLIVSDITEQKRLEQELLNVQKLESLGILAGGIAHDFNNILSSILGNIEISKLYAESNTELKERLAKAEKAITRAKELVQQLLTFSKGGVPIRKTTSIVYIVKETASFVIRGSNVKCRYNIPDDIWSVEVDTGQISQVINNLIINAEQAMPKGGIIDISMENITVPKDNNLAINAGSYVKIFIQDHGQGIPEEHLTKIFDPYFTTKEKGSGLGLATSYSIIKKHGGYISVQSEPGVGTMFELLLPASFDKSKGDDIKDDIVSHGQGRILIMDDEEEIRDVIAQMLKHCGYEVTLTKDGAELVEIYQKEKIAGRIFDVVIVDLTIPGGVGGKEAMEIILSINPDAKVVVSSGYSTDPIIANYKKHGFKAAIIKPYNLKELSDIISKVIGKEYE